jgi:hypothetical protein
MENKHYSRKQRQLKYLVKQLTILLQKTDADLKSEIKKMAAKIKCLVSQLNGIVSTNRMKRILGGMALLIGISFSNTANAQYFQPPVTNPFGITPGYTYRLQSVNLIDIDNDGDLDLFTDSLTYGYYSYLINFNYQENIGTPTNPNFKVPQLNPFNLTLMPNDSSFMKRRHFVDLDGDGDFDVLSTVTYLGYYSFLSTYRYYENIGTPSAPNFTTAILNPFGLQASGNILLSAIGDIDNDGDFDIISTNYSYTNSFEFIENTGSNISPMFGAPQTNTFGLPAGGGLVLPTLTDLDADGDLDIIFGEYSYVTYGGSFKYYENTGTSNSAQFTAGTINPYGLIGTGIGSTPTLEFKDLDNDGDVDLLAGTNVETYYFENSNTAPPALSWDCDATLGCIDPGTGTGLYTSLTGCQSNCTPLIIEDSEINNLKLYPNPANNTLNISSDKKIKKIEIYDALGRVIYAESNPSSEINVEQLESGLYSIAIIFDDNRIVKKFTK